MIRIWIGLPPVCARLRHNTLAALGFGGTVALRAEEVQAGANGEPNP